MYGDASPPGMVSPGNAGYSANPYANYDDPFALQQQRPEQIFQASAIASQKDIEKRQADSNIDPTAVSLPPHLFIPSDAQSVDIRNLVSVPPATTVDILDFRGRQGGYVKFIGYAIFNDALLLSSIDLIPLVNGARVLPFHGNPNDNFKMGLGLSPDLSVLIPCQLDLQPQDRLIWRFTNNGVVDVSVGVRMNGYYSQSTQRKVGRFGG